ncbi:hypothetical protein PoB_007011500 [Plakobranchus ocellatus]|uniref:Uncharacterized protein n=1 Tax=Plakobranchus ocellatus TaxID=259542 RepID=A0AAV4DI20_9GAST|nr:hypothetical protein PoB_007011500 [Plakobranchus ocellatus]
MDTCVISKCSQCPNETEPGRSLAENSDVVINIDRKEKRYQNETVWNSSSNQCGFGDDFIERHILYSVRENKIKEDEV